MPGFCFCRPRKPEDTGVAAADASSPAFPEWGGDRALSNNAFMDELAASSFSHNKDLDWCINDPTEPTLEEDEDEEDEDPYESWYRFWYAKGILSFVPQSIQQAEAEGQDWSAFQSTEATRRVSETHPLTQPPQPPLQTRPSRGVKPTSSTVPSQQQQSKPPPKRPVVSRKIETPAQTTTFTPKSRSKPSSSSSFADQQSSTLPVVSRKIVKPYSTPQKNPVQTTRTFTPETPPITPSPRKIPTLTPPRATTTRASPSRKSLNTVSRQTFPDDASEILVCACCDKQVTNTNVRCPDCKTTFYCCVFCKGNDRYKHARKCDPNAPKTQQTCPIVDTDDACFQAEEPAAPSLHKYWEDRSKSKLSVR